LVETEASQFLADTRILTTLTKMRNFNLRFVSVLPVLHHFVAPLVLMTPVNAQDARCSLSMFQSLSGATIAFISQPNIVGGAGGDPIAAF
jgi:hypothetical protein